MERKNELRRSIRERLSHLSQSQRDTESRVICRELRAIIGDCDSLIAGYVPLSDEPYILPLLSELLAHGTQVCLPAILNNKLVFRAVTDIHRQTEVSGLTRLREPLSTLPEVDASDIAVVIVPGRAFTMQCERLGRGNGGYDMWIAELRRRSVPALCIGTCFECQLMHDVPLEPHDQPLDLLVTSRGVFRRS